MKTRYGIVGLCALACSGTIEPGAELTGSSSEAASGPSPCSIKPWLMQSFFNDGFVHNPETDTSITKAAPNTNWSARPQLWAHGDPDAASAEQEFLLRWEFIPGDPTVPVGTICSASIQLYVTEPATDLYFAYQILRPWTFDQATWNQASASDPWQVPGAKGPMDRSSEFLGAFPALRGNSATKLTIPASLVQAWIDHPTENYGVLIANLANPDSLRVASRNDAEVSNRPRLTVSYVPRR